MIVWVLVMVIITPNVDGSVNLDLQPPKYFKDQIACTADGLNLWRRNQKPANVRVMVDCVPMMNRKLI